MQVQNAADNPYRLATLAFHIPVRDNSVIEKAARDKMNEALMREITALYKNPNARGEDYVRLAHEAERLGCTRERAMLLRSIQLTFPRSLDLAAPSRSVAAFDAIDAIIGSVRQRLSLAANTRPNKAIAGIGMTNTIPLGPNGGLTLPLYSNVAFEYRNPEGYSATVAVHQEFPDETPEYVVAYRYPSRTRAPISHSEAAGLPCSALLPPPKAVENLFEHLLRRVIAGQHLDGPSEPGAFYR